MSNPFNDEHQGGQHPDRSKEVLDIFGTMKLDPNGMGQDKGAYGHGQRRIDVGGGREETGHKSYQVAYENVEENGGNVGEESPSLRPSDVHHEILQTFNNNFQKVLSLPGEQLDTSDEQCTTDNHDEHHKP